MTIEKVTLLVFVEYDFSFVYVCKKELDFEKNKFSMPYTFSF